jgi:hypothetical protein
MEKVIELLEDALEDMIYVTKIPEYSQEVAYIREAINIVEHVKSPPCWETPEQYRERTGKQWEGAVYFNLFNKKEGHSVYIDGKYQTHRVEDALVIIDRLENQQHCHDYTAIVICANNDNGKPPDGWRPEEE